MSEPYTAPVRPKTLADIKRLVAQNVPPTELLYAAAQWLLDHPREVATVSKHKIAEEIESDKKIRVTSAELTRLAIALNCLSYAELRAIFRRELNEGTEGSWYSSFVVMPTGDNPVKELLQSLFFAEMDNLEETFDANAETILHAANIILDAKDHSVNVLGWRSCFPAAYLFNYVYRFFRQNSHLIQDVGGAGTDGVRWIEGGDVLIAISIAPYTTDVVKAVEYAAEKKARIVAITDNAESPLAQASTVALYIESVTPSFFHSVAAMISLVEALLAVVFILGGDESIRLIGESEKQLSRFRAYWPADASEPSGQSRTPATARKTGPKRPKRG